MSEPIDELLVRLGLETDAKSFKDADNLFAGMRSTAIATGAAIAGAFAGMVSISSDVARSADELAKWTRTAGVTAQYASRLGYAMRQVGGDASDALSLVELADSLRDQAQWGELADRAFTAAGFNPQQIQQENMSPEQVIDFLARGLSSMDRDTARQIAQALGISDISRRLLMDRAGMQESFRRADELGGIPSDELLDAAEAYSSATTELSQALDGFRQTIAEEMLPDMTAFYENLVKWSVENQEGINKAIEATTDLLKKNADMGVIGMLSRYVEPSEDESTWDRVERVLGFSIREGLRELLSAPSILNPGLSLVDPEAGQASTAETSPPLRPSPERRLEEALPQRSTERRPDERLLTLSSEQVAPPRPSSESGPRQSHAPPVIPQINVGVPNFAAMAPQVSGGVTNYYSIDARGSTDPGATADAIARVFDERLANAIQMDRDSIPKNVV